MRYVLESEKYPGNYLVFKHGSPPHVVDLKSAQKFDNVPKALNRISTIPTDKQHLFRRTESLLRLSSLPR